MYYEVAKGLDLDGDEEVSQAVELGRDNAITAEISIVSGVLGTGALTVTLEFSNDLDCWTNLSNYYVVTLGEAPAREFLPQYNGAEARFRFARLRYQAVGSAHVLLTASIFTYSQT